MAKINKARNKNLGEDVEKGEPSYTVGGNASWCSHFGKVWGLLKKLKIELPCDAAIALLGIYSKDKDVVKRRATCTPMFVGALAIVAKLWKGPRCPSTDKWLTDT